VVRRRASYLWRQLPRLCPGGASRPRHPGMEDRGHPGRTVGVRPSVHVSGRWIRAGQRARLGADRRSHVSCSSWNTPPILRCVHRPKVDAPRGSHTPVADADIALTGRRVRWFQEWICYAPDDPYWQATDHRANAARMPPVVYLQGGWYDFFLRGMLADNAALRTAGRTVRLLIGPWGHGRGLYTRVGMGDARWMPCSPTTRHRQGRECSLQVLAAGPTCPAGPHPPATPPGIYTRPASSAPT
jgi:hypothetical protein